MTDLNAAYKATTFTVAAPTGELSIRIGDVHPDIDQLAALLLGTHEPTTWCHITAHNPRSKRLTEAENRRRTRALEDDLRALQALLEEKYERSLAWLPGDGRSPDGEWVEAGFYVAGLTTIEAQALGARHEQNAVVTGSGEGIAQLTWVYGLGTVDGCRAQSTPPKVHGTAAELLEALGRLHDALSLGRIPAETTLQQLNQPWLRVVDEASWEALWWEAEGLQVDLDEVAQLDDILDGESGPTSQVVRGFRVCWSDGRALDVACLVSVDDWGSIEHEAVGFGLSEDAALAALAEGSAAIIGESNDECWTQTHTDELAEAFDAA